MKKAILTGHSKGLGVGLLQSLLAAGFEVLGVSRSAVGENHARLQEVSLDLGDVAAVTEFAQGVQMEAFLAEAQEVILINNAGIVEPIAPLGRQNADMLTRAISVNITGPLLLSNAFVASTEAATDRRIAHISSGAGRKPYTGWSVYCATKAALDHHARSAADDALPNLKIESIAPGVIDTGMQATIRATPKEDFSILQKFQKMKTDGELTQAAARGEAIVAHVLGDSFGQEILTDARQF